MARRISQLALCAFLVLPTASSADPSEDALQRYRSVAGPHPFTIKGNRAEFSDGVATWTILGATQEKGTPHGPPARWSVGSQPYQLLTVEEPISDTYILPDSDPVPNTRESSTITIAAAQGETEPASFVLRSGTDALSQVRITAPSLKRQRGTGEIPSQNIDIRLVKAWYQASDSIHRLHGGGKTLVPELLVHDSDLVRIDHQHQVNLVRDVARLNDAERLLPFSIPPRSNQQIWMTVVVPESIAAGPYTGEVTVEGERGGAPFSTHVQLTVHVLPIRLAEAPIDYALYYLAWWNPGQPNLDARAKTGAQLLAEFQDMRAHGLTNVAIDHDSLHDQDFTALTETLRRMRAANFRTNTLLYVDWKVSQAADPALYARKLLSLKQTAREQGFAQVLVYNLDEQDSETLLKHRASFELAHQHGLKNFVAFNAGRLETLSGLLDLVVLPRGTPRTVQIARQAAIIPWAYGDPQAGEEKPFTYRARYGIGLWLDGFDGACDYAYQTANFGWDDWGDPKWRPHNMSYPTLTTPVPTLQWEGFREAIDDTRYLATALPPERRDAARSPAERRRLLMEELHAPTLTPRELRLRLVELLLSRGTASSRPGAPDSGAHPSCC
jgi:glycosyl hydrolase family 123